MCCLLWNIKAESRFYSVENVPVRFELFPFVPKAHETWCLMVSRFSCHVKDGDVVMADPFSSKRNDKYYLEQKQNLDKLWLKYKFESETEPKKHWNLKREKHVAPSLSFKPKSVRKFSLHWRTNSLMIQKSRKRCSWPPGAVLYYYTTQLYYYWHFEIFPPYTIIPPYTTIDFSRCFHPILLFCPILLLSFSCIGHPILLFCPRPVCLFRS